MNGPQHMAVGGVSAGLILWGLRTAGADVGSSVIVTGSVVAAVGALAPDIDHANATIGMRIPVTLIAFGGTLLLLPLMFATMPAAWDAQRALGSTAWFNSMGALLFVPGAVLLLLSIIAARTSSHRGPTHSFAFAGGSAVVASAAFAGFGIAWWYGLFFAWGWLTHLAADSRTPKGLQSLFWPRVSGEALPTPSTTAVARTSTWPTTVASLAVGAAVLAALVAVGWLSGWGMRALVAGVQRPVATAARSTGTPVVDAALARQRLGEASPEIAAGLTDPEHPDIVASGGLTAFTWQYLSKPSASSVAVKRITITLDSAGHVVGADGD